MNASHRELDSIGTRTHIPTPASARVGKSWRGTFFKKISTTFSQIIFSVNKLATWLFFSKNEKSIPAPEIADISITQEKDESENSQLSKLKNELQAAINKEQEAVKKLQEANNEVSNLRAQLEDKPIEVKKDESEKIIAKDLEDSSVLNSILCLVNKPADFHQNVTQEGLKSFLNYLKTGIFLQPIPPPPGPPPPELKESSGKSLMQAINERKAKRIQPNTPEDQPKAEKKLPIPSPHLVPNFADIKNAQASLKKAPPIKVSPPSVPKPETGVHRILLKKTGKNLT